jgi:hypothetical protein
MEWVAKELTLQVKGVLAGKDIGRVRNAYARRLGVLKAAAVASQSKRSRLASVDVSADTFPPSMRHAS